MHNALRGSKDVDILVEPDGLFQLLKGKLSAE